MGHLNDSGIVVQTVTLDALVSSGNIRVPSVIKCDIEGAEYRALLGAARFVLSHYRPAIFVATHTLKFMTSAATFSVVWATNYRLNGAAVETSRELLTR